MARTREVDHFGVRDAAFEVVGPCVDPPSIDTNVGDDGCAFVVVRRLVFHIVDEQRRRSRRIVGRPGIVDEREHRHANIGVVALDLAPADREIDFSGRRFVLT